MLINDQRPLVSGLAGTVRHEMVHELGVARGGGLILGHDGANRVWSGIANTGCR